MKSKYIRIAYELKKIHKHREATSQRFNPIQAETFPKLLEEFFNLPPDGRFKARQLKWQPASF